jgi:hypothetical protein
VLRVPAGFSYVEGQSIGVLTPGPHPFGNAQHLRLYSIADPRSAGEGGEIAICVRRCFYIDEVSGERYKGISSNHPTTCAMPAPARPSRSPDPTAQSSRCRRMTPPTC